MSLDTLLSVLFVVVFIVLPLVSRSLQRNRSRGTGLPPGRASTPPPRGMAPRQGPAPQGPVDQAGVPPWLAEAQRRVREAAGERSTEATSAPSAGRPLVSEDAFGRLAPSAQDQPWVPPAPAGTLAPTAQDQPWVPPVAGGTLAPSVQGESWVPPASADALGPTQRPGGLVPGDPFKGGLVRVEGERRAGTGLGRAGAWPPGSTGPTEGARTATEGTLPRTGIGVAVERPRAVRHGARLGAVGQLRFERGAIVSGLIWHEILDEPAWKRRRGRRPSRLR